MEVGKDKQTFYKQALDKIKALFSEEQVATSTAVEPMATTDIVVELKDGNKLTVDKLEVGGIAKIEGVLAASGEYEANDGSTIKVGEDGVISEIVAAPTDAGSTTATTTTVSDAAPAQMSVQLSATEVLKAEQIEAIQAQFAVGTPEERIARLETLMKPLIEYAFGYEIRESQTKAMREQAVAIYKEGFEAVESEEVNKLKLELSKVDETSGKLKEVVKEMFEIVEHLANVPASDPVETPKLSFSQQKVKDRETRLKEIADATKQYREKQNQQ